MQKTQHIAVQADRTATVNAALKVGQTTTTVEVEASPLMNAVDTTNGYVLDKAQIEAVPLATGSFTGLATQSPGRERGAARRHRRELRPGQRADLGQRPARHLEQFLLNGVDASNLFNGKSTSQVASARVINSTGVQTSPGGGGGVIPSAASIYLSIGNAIPTPAPETIEEVRVNASMYDAQQGSTSGAHIDLSTASGTNACHGTAYAHRGTNWINAAPFFFNQDPDVPANDKSPELHRYMLGGTVGGPIIKDKLFGFLGLPAPARLRPGDRRLVPGCSGGPERRPTARRLARGPEQQLVRCRQLLGYDIGASRTSIQPRWRCSIRRRCPANPANG